MGYDEESYIDEMRLGLATTMLACVAERYRFWLAVSVLVNVALAVIIVAMVVS